MAEEPIRKEDIIDSEGIITELQKLIDLLNNGLVPALSNIKKTAKEAGDAIQAANPATPEGQAQIKEKAQVLDSLGDEYKQLTQTEKELLKIQEELKKTYSAEYQQLIASRQGLAARKKEVADNVKQDQLAEGSITRLKKQLADLKKAYYDASPDKRSGMVDGVKNLTNEISKAEKAIGVHSRGVGNYKNSIVEAGKSLLGFGGAIGVAAGLLGKLKNAFFETEAGAGFLKRTSEGLKGFFQTLTMGGEMDLGKLILKAGKAGIEASKVAAKTNEIRIGDRKDLIEVAKMETEIQQLRYKSADATLSEAEQLKYLNRAIAVENKLMAFNIADKQEELDVVKEMLLVRPTDVKLLDQYYQLESEIIRLKGDKNLRLMSRASALQEKIDKERLKNQINTNIYIDQTNLKQLQGIEAISLAKKDLNTQEIEAFNATTQKQNEALIASAENQKRLDKEVTAQKIANAIAVMEATSQAINLVSSVFERAKQRELSAAGDNAVKRAEIEKEYFKKQKALSISQAIINGALSLTNMLANIPAAPINPLYWVGVGISAATVAAQVAIIAAQKFAEGGLIEGKSHAQGGTHIEAEGGEYVVKKQSTSKYKGLIEAINEDNPMRIAEEIRNRNFHAVWGGVSAQLSTVSKQDPYTRLTYELLKNKPDIYQDSNGDTVLNYADGRKRVIKKYTA